MLGNLLSGLKTFVPFSFVILGDLIVDFVAKLVDILDLVLDSVALD